jgi:hypothetical protein
VGLVWYVGKRDKRKFRRMGRFIQYFGGVGQFGNVGLSWKEMYGLEKYVCIFCVILMEDG